MATARKHGNSIQLPKTFGRRRTCVLHPGGNACVSERCQKVQRKGMWPGVRSCVLQVSRGVNDRHGEPSAEKERVQTVQPLSCRRQEMCSWEEFATHGTDACGASRTMNSGVCDVLSAHREWTGCRSEACCVKLLQVSCSLRESGPKTRRHDHVPDTTKILIDGLRQRVADVVWTI